MPVRPQPEVRISLAARLVVFLLPLILLAVLELIFRLAGVGRPEAADPFIGLLKSHRVFQLDQRTGQYSIDRDRARSFNVQSFPAIKAKGTFRIFCFGGSAAFGYPFGDPVSFSRWLRDGCHTLWPNTRFEVINSAGMSYGTYRERALMDEILDYEPDLVILYSGHNEFIEKEFYQKAEAVRFAGLRSFLSHFHVYNAFKEGVLRLTRTRQRKELEVNEFGLHVQRRENLTYTPEERERVYQKYRENLTAIAETLRRAHVPLMMLVPAPNLAGWKPEHSSLGAGLQGDSLTAWSVAYGAGTTAQGNGNYPLAISEYRVALRLDDHFAELQYRMGQCLSATGNYGEAESRFKEALDRDEVPIRLSTRQREIVREVATKERAMFGDAWSLFEQLSPHQIVGSNLLWDYCHPNVTGHQYVAALACSILVADRLLPPPAPPAGDLQSGPVRDVHLASLGFAPAASFDLTKLLRGADGLWWLGNCAQRQGRGEEATQWFTRSLEVDPNHPGSLIGLGIALSQQGRHDEAISMGLRAISAYERIGMTPMVARSRFELSVFYSRAGKLAEAVQQLQQVLSLNPSYPGAHKMLGRTLADLGRYDEAEKALGTGIQVFANEPGLHKELGRTYRLQGKIEPAIEEYEQEIRVAPGDGGTHVLLGDLLRQANRTAEAAAQWEVALGVDPTQEDIVLELAKLYQSIGKTADARRVVRQYLSLGRPATKLDGIRKSLGV